MILLFVLSCVVSRNRVVFGLAERALFYYSFSKFQKDSNTSLGPREEVINQRELQTFEPKNIDFAQQLAQLVNIHCHPQILSQIFQFAQQKRFKNRHHLSVQVVSVIKFLFTVKGWNRFHCRVAFFMLIELLLVLLQLRNIISDKFYQRRTVLMRQKFLLNSFESHIADLQYEVGEVSQVNLLHQIYWLIYQIIIRTQTQICWKNMLRHPWPSALASVMLMLTMNIVECTINCNNTGAVAVPDTFSNFAFARKLSLSEEQTLISLYSSLSNLSDYQVSISSTFSLYLNYKAVCNKKPTYLQNYNADQYAWVCFDQFYMIECNQQWELLIKCGTFIEFHLPFNPNILISVNLSQQLWQIIFPSTKITSINLKGLCAGTYHVWFVYYTRGGKFLRAVKTIFISHPNCDC